MKCFSCQKKILNKKELAQVRIGFQFLFYHKNCLNKTSKIAFAKFFWREKPNQMVLEETKASDVFEL